MKSNSKARSWAQVAPNLVNRLRTDWRNAKMLSRPWSRAAHNMVNGWRIRLSRPPARGDAPRTGSARTWKEFARRAVSVAVSKVKRARQSEWHRWAQYKVSGGSRYIPKAMQK